MKEYLMPTAEVLTIRNRSEILLTSNASFTEEDDNIF